MKVKHLLSLPINNSETVEAYLNKKLVENELYRGLNAFKKLIPDIFSSKKLSKEQKQAILQCLRAPTRTFKGLLDRVNKEDFKLTVPSLDNKAYAKPYLNRSAVLIPHHLREGEQTASWYHGPLITGDNPDAIDRKILPIKTSDVLYRYDKTINLLDVSYAAAWEIGRLIMLNNKSMAMELYSWKQKHAQEINEAEKDIFYDHLPFKKSSSGNTMSDKLLNWFNNLNLLYNVPFNYIVPDEKLLPNESIRFFYLDNFWVERLMDGAFSIGRISNLDLQRDRGNGAPKPKYPSVTGFFLRSEVVSGWPSLLVDGFKTKQPEDKINIPPLPILRIERLSSNILICLFNGKVSTVDIHLKKESIHMGYVKPNEEHHDYYKELRDLQTGKENDKSVPISWKNKVNRIIDINVQAKSIKAKLGEAHPLNPAQFALEMIEGVPRVRFNAT